MVPPETSLDGSDRDPVVGREPTADAAPATALVDSEDIHLRNYDDDRAYRFTLVASDDDGPVFRRQYHLAPGEYRSESNLLDPAVYDVRVELADGPADGAVCSVGTPPGRTVCVEVGNNVVSVSEGVQ